MPDSILKQVKSIAERRILFLPHAIQQMSRPDRMITASEVELVVAKAEIIEDYPNDLRGHSCLLLGYGEEDRPIHVVCTPKDEYLAIITAYVPDPVQWSPDFRRRL